MMYLSLRVMQLIKKLRLQKDWLILTLQVKFQPLKLQKTNEDKHRA